jgi:hypothetical protein
LASDYIDVSDQIQTTNNITTSSEINAASGKNINWNRDILPLVRKEFKIAKSENIPLTLRGLLYIFESQQVLRKSAYGQLSKKLTEWRENGKVPLDVIVDTTRHIIDITRYESVGKRILVEYDESLQTFSDLVSPVDHFISGIYYLNNAVDDIYNNIPIWLDQSKYLEIFVEKSAMASSFNSILNSNPPDDSPRNIIVVPNRGWSSTTFVLSNIHRLIQQQRKGKEVYVQYYGDSDPTGERMTADDSKLLTKLRQNKINFERIAINERTISDFNLEDIRDQELDDYTFDKLDKKDPNSEWFKARHDGRVWQIELDALQTNRQKFRELVLSNVDKHFDTSVRKEAIERYKELYPVEELHNKLKDLVKALFVDME